MAFERFYITNQGAQYLALAQAGSKLVITKAQIGTGYLGSGQSAVSRTALVTPLKDCAIQSKQAVGSTVNVTMQFVNTDGAGNVLDPFWWAEVGLFAKLDNDPDHPEILFAYANAMDEAHADYIPGTLTEFLFVMSLNVQNAADNVQVDITAPVLYLAKNGDGSEVTTDVTDEASAMVGDLTPGSTVKRLFGKMKKLIADIQANKASKVTGATLGNFAGLDASGELTDSGKKASDFASADALRYAIYKSPSEIGLASGATLQQCFAALPNYSILLAHRSEIASADAPLSGAAVGYYEITKSADANRSSIFYWGLKVTDGDWRMYVTSGVPEGIWNKLTSIPSNTSSDLPLFTGSNGAIKSVSAADARAKMGVLTLEHDALISTDDNTMNKWALVAEYSKVKSSFGHIHEVIRLIVRATTVDDSEFVTLLLSYRVDSTTQQGTPGIKVTSGRLPWFCELAFVTSEDATNTYGRLYIRLTTTARWALIASLGYLISGGTFSREFKGIVNPSLTSLPSGTATATASVLKEDYSALTLLNGFTGWVKFNRLADGLVVARFSLTPGTLTNLTQIAVFPSGYRPGVRLPLALIVGTSYAFQNFTITSDGNLYNIGALTAGLTYTGSIAYIAE